MTGSAGQVLANTAVTLTDNLAYSCADGVTWTVASLNLNPGCNGGTEGTLQGTTDASGNVTFTLVDANTSTGSDPADTTTAAGAEANEKNYPWTRVVLQVGDDVFTANPNPTVDQATDLVDLIIIPSPG